jgi:hypothetical protein
MSHMRFEGVHRFRPVHFPDAPVMIQLDRLT